MKQFLVRLTLERKPEIQMKRFLVHLIPKSMPGIQMKRFLVRLTPEVKPKIQMKRFLVHLLPKSKPGIRMKRFLVRPIPKTTPEIPMKRFPFLGPAIERAPNQEFASSLLKLLVRSIRIRILVLPIRSIGIHQTFQKEWQRMALLTNRLPRQIPTTTWSQILVQHCVPTPGYVP